MKARTETEADLLAKRESARAEFVAGRMTGRAFSEICTAYNLARADRSTRAKAAP